MPRIRASDNDPLDFCLKCFPEEKHAEEDFGSVGDGPDGRGNCYFYDDDHPDYGGEDYHCRSCNKLLNSRDNYKGDC